MIKFDVEQVVALHDLAIEQIGGAVGVKDGGLLESAVLGIYQSFGGQDLYPTVEEKCARLGYNLINNHAFVDGNKRTGMLAMLTLLEMNNINIVYTDDEVIEIGFGLATGKLSHTDVTKWIKNKEKQLEVER